MSNAFDIGSLVVSPGQTVSVSQLMNISASSSKPAYLVLNGYDRNEYTAGSTSATGSFSGNGRTLGFSAIGGDARGAGIAFSYVAASGRYYSASYGYLDQLTYTASTSVADITDLSLFGTSSSSLANTYAFDAIALAQHDPAGYLGTLTVAVEPGFGPAPTQATPFSIAAVARTFVGSVCNDDGCWVLASTISAEAGASLPVQSAVNMAGAASGEWIIAYNGPAGSTGDWASSVRTGDMIGFITAANTGHITTCVSGYGSSAMVIDNAAFLNAQGGIANDADDGGPQTDIIVQAEHLASQEWAGVSASSVVIFRLDTPVVATMMATLKVSAGGSANLASVFSAADPAGKAITSYQAYSASATDWFSANGTTISATSAASAVTISSLSQIDFNYSGANSSDTVSVRAFNGMYWGDWTTISTPITAATIATAHQFGTADDSDTSIYRFFDTHDGTHFFTASTSEAETLRTTRTDLSYEGVGLRGYTTADASPSAEAVFRFFDTTDGTHFYTASTVERDSLLATPSSPLTYEGAAFYEDSSPQSGDSAVYRFFDTAHGTHLFTQSASERASILATRTDLVAEGIAFYAPN